MNEPYDPHGESEVLTAGAPIESARAAAILVHGRGASAGDILSLTPHIDSPGIAWFAPQAYQSTWYPNGFMAPSEQNEPWLGSALGLLGWLLADIQSAGIPPERIALLGFSQGACLALTFAARAAQRYGALVGYSGGLIGPPEARFAFKDTLAGTPVFLGCSNVDPHIPLERVEETARVLTGMGAQVDKRIYPGMGHQVNEDELAAARALLAGMAGSGVQ
ncbi:MAG: dienelactone hydrolase family protein [Chloroflexi bacterium]|nr:dienelactone hydrolase family protein [Chloroflexota bacterium]